MNPLDQAGAGRPERAYLVVTITVRHEFANEFNRWYNEEHFPERLRVPGFLGGRRMVTHAQERSTYVAFYELSDVGVLDSPQYQAVSPANKSPWTSRILGMVEEVDRAVYTDITPHYEPADPT